jgi:hypothetical protein
VAGYFAEWSRQVNQNQRSYCWVMRTPQELRELARACAMKRLGCSTELYMCQAHDCAQ